MTENAANIRSSRRKHMREPPSIPFLWEDRPGVAKKDWRPTISSVNIQTLPSPVKLIASVPFIWEEKPGKPLSTHCLSANCLVSTSDVSAAVPVSETSFTVDINGHPSSPASETDSSISSYATGISSLAGSTFLECLFPLYARNSSFQGDADESNHFPPEEMFDNSNPGDDDDDVMARRTVTLGELIMMSRRMSCQRKAVRIAKQNLSMEFIKKKGFGCGIFEAGIHMLQGLQRKRQHLLKLL